MSTIKAPPIYKIIVSQFIAVVFITAAGYVTRDLIVAYSLLLGGLICAVPNAYFTLRAFRYRGASATQQIVRDFYVGEGIKLLLIGSGFALVFSSVDPLNALALFAGFVLVFVVGLAALIFIQTKHVDT